MRRVLLFVVASLLVVGAGPAAGSAERELCAMNSVETYSIEAEARRKTYSRSGRAVVDILVTRLDTGVPAAGADVIAAAVQVDELAFEETVTDADGEAVVRLKLRDLSRGWADVKMMASQTHAEPAAAVCGEVTEWGYARLYKAFRITR